ncbi:hypothetical protein FB451DRAFT_1561793 [Mycena latifolia]|nr:hypothetical protein FB451DRAFT_1561793 [Mycena latifolia]
MARNLPQELVHLVLCVFRTDICSERRVIADCGLICKEWLPSSRYRLFDDVALNDGNMKKFLGIVETSPFPITTFIRSLGVASGRKDGSLEENLRKLGPFPQMKSLRITMDRVIFVQKSQFLANFFAKTVSSLTLYNCHLSLSSVMDALSHFPTLKSFKLLWVYFDGRPLPPAAEYQLPSGCRALSLDHQAHHIEPFFKAILSFKTIPIFSSLSVRGEEPTECSSLGDYLRRAGDGIHHLRFESDFSFFSSSPTNLQFCTGLRRLELVFHHSLDIPATLLRILPHLRSSHLATVHVTDNYGRNVQEGWEVVDDALADQRFAQLRAFTVQALRSQLERWDLPDSMPSSQARGILRMVAV